MTTTGELEARVRHLEDIEEIRLLKARYCEAVDARDSDAWVDLYTVDAEWRGGRFGTYLGLEAIGRYFNSILQNLSFTVHLVTNERIEVDGDRATGRWSLLEPCTFSDGNVAVLGAGVYDEQYLRTDSVWKIARLELRSVFWTPFDKGWAVQPYWDETPSITS